MAASCSPDDSFHVFKLFAENENALLAGEANLLHLPVFSQQHGVVAGFRVAVFPAAFAFGHNGSAFLYGDFIAIDQQTVLTGLQVGLANFSGLRDVENFADGLGDYWDC